MALQSQRRTKSSKKRRASHFSLKKKDLTTCIKCGKPVRAHHVCNFCGTYKNKSVLKIKGKKEKTAKKKKAQEKAGKE